ncbi:MAG: polysaccharide deacetylase family protein [Phycisphaeraceae bacterium]
MAIVTLPILAAGAAVVTAGAWIAHGIFAPRAQLFGRPVYRGTTAAPPRVALTFDDGPHPDATDAILATLARLNAPATFFVVGANVARWPEVLRRIDAGGHAIGSHSYDHAYHAIIRGPRYWRQQVQRTDAIIEEVIGRKPTLFRPPMGFKSPPIVWAMRGNGEKMVTWSRRGRDGVRASREQILQRLAATKAGDIILLHDGVAPGKHRDPTPTVEALPALIESLRSKNLRIVPLAEMMEGNVAAPHHGYQV